MAGTKEIYVLNKRVRLLQPEGGFRTSLDSVMLAAACPVKEGETVLDLGCGVGGAGFCVLERVADTHLTGIDIQADHIALAKKNIVLNKRKGRAEFICADVRNFSLLLSPRKRGSSMPDKGPRFRGEGNILFHHVICNPPYLDAGTHTPSPSGKKAKALYHDNKDISVKDWIDTGFHNLRNGGSFTIIHRADHADKIIQAFGKKFGAVEIIPLWPRKNQPAKRVIIRARKNRKTPATIHPGIVLHEKDGGYTKAADKILRGGAFIFQAR